MYLSRFIILCTFMSTFSGGFNFILKGVEVEHVPLSDFLFYVSTRTYYY